MLANPVKRLVKRRKSLLPVENETNAAAVTVQASVTPTSPASRNMSSGALCTRYRSKSKSWIEQRALVTDMPKRAIRHSDAYAACVCTKQRNDIRKKARNGNAGMSQAAAT